MNRLAFGRITHLIGLLVAMLSCDAHAQTIVETFSGTGSFTSNTGQPGFENPGWINTGGNGFFMNNGFGEDVYQVATTNTFGGVLRGIGDASFSAEVEFSTMLLMPGELSLASTRVSDPSASSALDLYINRQNNGDYTAQLWAIIDGNYFSGGALSLGSSVDRATLRLDFAPDLINGGSLFDAWVDVNESGNFQQVGSFDGTVYDRNASTSRTFFLGAYGFGAPTQVELDRFSLVNQPIPEPSSTLVIGTGLFGLLLQRRKRRPIIGHKS